MFLMIFVIRDLSDVAVAQDLRFGARNNIYNYSNNISVKMLCVLSDVSSLNRFYDNN